MAEKKYQIDKLTDEQTARFGEWVDKWVAVGRDTRPANFEEAEDGIRECYKAAKLDEPVIALHVGSPFAAVTLGPVLSLMCESLGDLKVLDKQAKSLYGELEDELSEAILAA